MRKQEVNLMKVRGRGTKANIIPKLDLTLSAKQTENCKAGLYRNVFVMNMMKTATTTTNTTTTTTTTTTTITTTNNKINNVDHSTRVCAVTEERWRYSFNTLSTAAHIDVCGQHEAPPTALSPEKIPYPFYRRIIGPRGRYGKTRKISPTGI